MKYFTKDWCLSKLDDEEIERRLKSYREYIQEIYMKLPFALKLLVQNINLHDGKLEFVFFSPDEKKLTLRGIFGDLELNYFFLEIKYLMVSNLNIDLLTHIFENKKLEILSDEIEMLTDNLFSHRILLSTQRDIEIQFEGIELKIQNALPENYKKLCCEFKVI